MKRSNIEEYCKKSFQKFLNYRFNIKNTIWEVGDEPPDYYLIIDNRKYAVEVTTIMDEVSLNNKKFPRLTISSALYDLTKKIEQESSEKNHLNGGYVVLFKNPVSNLKEYKDKIKEYAINFIRDTKEEKETRINEIFEKGKEKISIIKLTNERNFVDIGGPARANWHSEAMKEAQKILKERINTKSKKLLEIQMYKILLLLNQHLFLDLEDYRELYIDASFKQKFHTIFIVQSEEKGYLLYSQGF